MHFTDTYIVWSKCIIHKIIILRMWHVVVSASAIELPTYFHVFAIPCGKEYCLRQIKFERHCGQQFLQKWDAVQLIKAKWIDLMQPELKLVDSQILWNDVKDPNFRLYVQENVACIAKQQWPLH
jgi:hypothetical protein